MATRTDVSACLIQPPSHRREPRFKRINRQLQIGSDLLQRFRQIKNALIRDTIAMVRVGEVRPAIHTVDAIEQLRAVAEETLNFLFRPQIARPLHRIHFGIESRIKSALR